MGAEDERDGASTSRARSSDEGSKEDEGCVLLEQTSQLIVGTFNVRRDVRLTRRTQGIMTILRDRTTERGDFIFYADRLSTLIVEKALELLPYRPMTVKTLTGASYKGYVQTDEVGSARSEVFHSDFCPRSL